MVELMKVANQTTAVLLYLLRGRHATNADWVLLQGQYPHSLGAQRINSLLTGGSVKIAQLKFSKSAPNQQLQKAKVLITIPQSYQVVVNEVRDAEMAINKGEAELKVEDMLTCASPMANECSIRFVQADCTSAGLVNIIPRGQYKGFTASINFGYNQYQGDEKATTMEEAKMMISQCHLITTALQYFIMISCRANDRELIFDLLTESRSQQQVSTAYSEIIVI